MRYVLLGPLKLRDGNEEKLVFKVDSDLAPTETIELLVDRIAALYVHRAQRRVMRREYTVKTYFAVYEAADDEEFGRLRAYSTSWPNEPLEPVSRLRESWLLGSVCDGEFYPRLIEDTSCIPKYKEIDVTIRWRSVNRSQVYARSPTPREILEWRMVTGNNVEAIAKWLLSPTHTGGYIYVCNEYRCSYSSFEGPLPATDSVVSARSLKPPFDQLVLARRGYLYKMWSSGGSEATELNSPAVYISFYRGGVLRVHATTGRLDDVKRLFEDVVKRLGEYAGGEENGVTGELAELAENASKAHARKLLVEKLRARTPSWAAGVVVVELDGRLAAYPVKLSRSGRAYYFRVKWRPVDEGPHLEPLKDKLILKKGGVEEVDWVVDGEYVRIERYTRDWLDYIDVGV